MIGAIDAFSEIFGSVPEGDISWNTRVAKSAVKHGFGVVLIYPQDKVTACTLTAAQAQKANIEAQNAAKESGNLGWERVKHPCGVAHVITEEKDLNRVKVKELLNDGANIAIAPGTGEKRVAVADLDTSKQVETFRSLWIENGGSPEIGLTVASPGVFRGTWVHKDGGHIWFEIPDDIELPDRKGRFSWCECHGYKVNIPDPESPGKLTACPHSFAFYWASGYVLVPPSVRSEGAYRLMGEAVALPEWLASMAQDSVTGRSISAAGGALGRFDEDPIDEWSCEIEWGDILIGDGFTPAGHDNCGCPTFTRPGDATHSKSVTAHEPGCSLPWPDVSTGHLPMHIWSDALGGGRTLSKLSWIAESRYGGDMRAAMRGLGLRRLRDVPDISLDLERYESVTSPKSPTPETHGTNSDQPSKPGLLVWAESADYQERFSDEVIRQYVRKNATEYLREMDVREAWSPPTGESDFSILMDLPDSEIRYAIEDVLPMNGNAIVFAQFKSGKTTFILEVVRSLVDGDKFLGRFDVYTSGRVGLWNYELDQNMMTSWLRDTRMEHPENLRLINLRGKRVPLDTKYGQEWTIDWLRRNEIRTWIIDPAVRAMIGWGDENDNGAVTLFTDKLDEIKERAGVSELIIAHHTGRAEQAIGQERARGATRWDDWPDSRWILTQIPGGDTRFVRMTGRGNDVPERALSYDPQRRRVTLVGGGDPLASADRRTYEDEATKTRLLDFIAANPGMSKNKVMDGVGIKSQRVAGSALSALESEGKIYTVDAPNRAQLHYPGRRPDALESPSAVREIES
jgi:AAA domain-containing protein/bifunctional DNA primase/polymerase-like protein